MMAELSSNALSCTRHYYLRWYEAFRRGHGRLPAPHWEGPSVPGYNASHDAIVTAKRLAAKG
jgi:hypothetical protein